MKEILEKVDQLIEKSTSSSTDNLDERSSLRFEVLGIRNELNQTLRGFSDFYANRPLHPRGRASTKKWSQVRCPACEGYVKIRYTRKGVVRTGGAECKNCGTRFICRPDEEGDPTLELREAVPETISCPSCEVPFEILLDNIPGVFVDHQCEECSTVVKVSRTITGISIKALEQPTASPPLDLSFIDEVKKALPPQPWPKGVHKEIADQLGTTRSKVQKAIQALIKSRDVKPQIDGVVIEDSTTKADPDAN